MESKIDLVTIRDIHGYFLTNPHARPTINELVSASNGGNPQRIKFHCQTLVGQGILKFQREGKVLRYKLVDSVAKSLSRKTEVAKEAEVKIIPLSTASEPIDEATNRSASAPKAAIGETRRGILGLFEVEPDSPLTVKVIADVARITPQTTSTHLAKLMDEGKIQRTLVNGIWHFQLTEAHRASLGLTKAPPVTESKESQPARALVPVAKAPTVMNRNAEGVTRQMILDYVKAHPQESFSIEFFEERFGHSRTAVNYQFNRLAADGLVKQFKKDRFIHIQYIDKTESSALALPEAKPLETKPVVSEAPQNAAPQIDAVVKLFLKSIATRLAAREKINDIELQVLLEHLNGL